MLFWTWTNSTSVSGKNRVSKVALFQIYLLIQFFNNVASITFLVKTKYSLAYTILLLTVMLIISIIQLHYLVATKKIFSNTVR